MIICVDFDGTIVEHAYPKIGKPNIKLITKLIRLKNQGIKLILWSCRDKEELEEAVKWCKSVGLFFDAVNEDLPEIINSFKNKSKKVYGDIYLDDRNESIKDFLIGE